MSTGPLEAWYDLVRKLGHGPDLRAFEPDEAWDAYTHSADVSPDSAQTVGPREQAAQGPAGEQIGDTDFRRWLVALIAHELQDDLGTPPAERVPATEDLTSSDRENSAAADDRSERLALLKALTQLDDDDRDILIKHNVEELPFSTIAEIRGCPRDTARAMYARAFHRLRHHLLGSKALPNPASPSASPKCDADTNRSEAHEKGTILRALHQAGGDRLDAARLLGVGMSALYRKLHKFGLG